MKMKIFKFFVLLSILFSSFAHAQEVAPDSRGYIVKVGDSAPDLELLMLDGSIKKLSEFNSPVIVLNFFASWCGVCRKEIPHIEKEIWQPFKDKGVAIIGVNFKEKPDVAQKAKRETGMTYPVALDTAGKIFEQFARGGVTRNIVLDKNLKIIFLTRLFDTDEFEQMKSVIHKQLNIEKEEATKTMNKTLLVDFANTQKIISLEYNGEYKVYLEGKIFSAKKKKLEIGISLFKEDIVSEKYDKNTRSLKIGYKHFDGVRIAVLPMTKFKIPADTEKIIIFDAK